MKRRVCDYKSRSGLDSVVTGDAVRLSEHIFYARKQPQDLRVKESNNHKVRNEKSSVC